MKPSGKFSVNPRTANKQAAPVTFRNSFGGFGILVAIRAPDAGERESHLEKAEFPLSPPFNLD